MAKSYSSQSRILFVKVGVPGQDGSQIRSSDTTDGRVCGEQPTRSSGRSGSAKFASTMDIADNYRA
jgi:hypothetical protein